MKPNREMSAATRKKIDELGWKILHRAVKAKDHETVKDADLIIALLQSLAADIVIEDRHANQVSG